MTIELSSDQGEAFERVLAWLDEPSCPLNSILKMGGYAGSGKSTLLGLLAAEFQRQNLVVAYACFTGRAASVLSRKLSEAGLRRLTSKSYSDADIKGGGSKWYTSDYNSIFCGTLHRLLYKAIVNERDELLGFTKRSELDRKYDLLVVDEASMVSDEMLQDLQRHQVPILAVGDHGQLPPVAASGVLMQNPDVRLEKIHRQALDSPIIRFAHHLRETGRIETQGWDDRIAFRPQSELKRILRQAYAEASSPMDVGVLCWTNRRRVQLNSMIRSARGCEKTPKAGEVLVCLKNYPPVYNGMRGVLAQDVMRDERKPWLLWGSIAFPEEGIGQNVYSLCEPQFFRPETLKDIDQLRALGVEADRLAEGGSLMDFGYCLSVHKSQGSQFQHVIWYVDRPVMPRSEEWRKFSYTAATRAQHKLTVVWR